MASSSAKINVITAVVTPVSDEFDNTIATSAAGSTAAAATVDAALDGIVLREEKVFEQLFVTSNFNSSSSLKTGIIMPPTTTASPHAVTRSQMTFTAASLANAITTADDAKKIQDPLPEKCEFIPVAQSFSSNDNDNDQDLKPTATEKTANNSLYNQDDSEVFEAASILCMLAKARPNEEDIPLTMDMLLQQQQPQWEEHPQPSYDVATGSFDSNDNDHDDDDDDDEEEDQDMYEEEIVPPPKQRAAANTTAPFRHPDRLAISDDVDEVNRLHQYVRSDLLEIFVVPEVEEEDSSDDSDEDEYNHPPKKQRYERVTRGSTYCGTLSTSTAANRHYPGRVGFRCVHCANVRPVSAHATKSCFYPLRLHNLYREVCAWQRIHFKNCPFVPRKVRERYDWLKESDTSRGKVRYWETSAQRIGLENNPDRDDGIVFSEN